MSIAMLFEHAWLIQSIIIVLLGLTATWLGRHLYNKLIPSLERTHHVWDVALLKAAQTPYVTFVWLIVISILIPIISNVVNLHPNFAKYIGDAREILFVFALLWLLMRFISNVEEGMVERVILGKNKKLHDKTSIRAIGQLLRVIAIIIAVLITMQTLGLKINTLLTFGGIGGIAIGFAAKDTIANFIGGMMIYWDRPFSVGDWIRSPDREIEGTVENIGWRLTRILTQERRPLYVPNGVFSTIAVENPQRMLNRRIKTTIGLRYQDAPKIHIILHEIESMLRNHPEIDTHQTLMVYLSDFGTSALNFIVYAFTKTSEQIAFYKIRQDVFLKIIDIIYSHNAECAFPTTTLQIPDGILLQQKPGDLLK